MKAAIFDRFGAPLRVEKVADSTPNADGVVIKVSCCGICGSDLHMTEDDTFGLKGGEVIGHEFAGEVVALGRDATGVKVGDLLAVAPLKGCGACPACLRGEPAWCEMGMELTGGGYAEYAALAARQLRKLPDGLARGDGALAEPLAVALHGVLLSDMKSGDRVRIVGAGPIGLANTFWARRLGASAIAIVRAPGWGRISMLNTTMARSGTRSLRISRRHLPFCGPMGRPMATTPAASGRSGSHRAGICRPGPGWRWPRILRRGSISR